MLKKILGVVAGYLVMAVFVFVTFGITFMILGTEGSFQSGSYEVSGAWIVASIVLSFIAAILGGLTCYAIGKSFAASIVLAGIVLIFGILMAIPTLADVDEEALVRGGDVAMMDAMQAAHQPAWLAFLNPLIGAAGVVIGARLRKKPASGEPTAAPA